MPRTMKIAERRHAAIVAPLLALCIAVVGAAAQAQSNFGTLRDRIVAALKTDKGVSTRDVRALSKIKKPQARRLLVEVFEKSRSTAPRTSAIAALSTREHKSLYAFFVRVLDETRNARIAGYAATGLARQEDAGIQRLSKFALHLRKPVRDAAGKALLTKARRSQVAVNALINFIRDLPTTERSRPLTGLRGKKANKAMLDLFDKVARSSHEGSRCEALRLLGEAAPPDRTQRVVASVLNEIALRGKQSSKNLARAVLYAKLAGISASSAEETLLETLEIEDGLQDELKRLDRAKSAKDRCVQAVASIARKHEGPSERLVAIEILSALHHEKSDKALIDALNDESTAVALLAIQSVAARKPTGATPALERLLRGEHEELQLEAMLALHSIPKYRSRSSWPVRLREILAKGERLGLRCSAIDCLRELRDAKALSLVQECARAPDWQLRSAAFRYLEVVPDVASVGILVERLQEETGRLAGECLAALMLLTDKDFPKPRYWKRWWDSEGANWKLPKRKKVAKSKGGKKRRGKRGEEQAKPRRRALTYYNIPITSHAASFLVDVSGSMRQKAGTAREPKIQAAKKALEMVLKNCDEARHFNVVPFHHSTRPWQKSLQAMDKDAKTRAVAFTRKLKAGGGTNIHAALRHAFDDGKVDTIYLLSDGEPSTGEIVDPTALARAVALWNRERRIVIHTIAFGYHSKLLKKLASDSGGSYVKYL